MARIFQSEIFLNMTPYAEYNASRVWITEPWNMNGTRRNDNPHIWSELWQTTNCEPMVEMAMVKVQGFGANQIILSICLNMDGC